MCGCDFVELRGTNFPTVLDSLPSFVKTEPKARELLAKALVPDAREAVAATRSIKTLCYAVGERLAETPRRVRQGVQVREAEDDVLRKTVWLLAYWSGRERVADNFWGFQDAPACVE